MSHCERLHSLIINVNGIHPSQLQFLQFSCLKLDI